MKILLRFVLNIAKFTVKINRNRKVTTVREKRVRTSSMTCHEHYV